MYQSTTRKKKSETKSQPCFEEPKKILNKPYRHFGGIESYGYIHMFLREKWRWIYVKVVNRKYNTLKVRAKALGNWYHVPVDSFLQQKDYIQAAQLEDKDKESWKRKCKIRRISRKNPELISLVNRDILH